MAGKQNQLPRTRNLFRKIRKPLAAGIMAASLSFGGVQGCSHGNLALAAKNGDIDEARALVETVETNAKPSVGNQRGTSLLMMAASGDERSLFTGKIVPEKSLAAIEEMRFLLENGADVDERSEPGLAVSGAATIYIGGGRTPLMYAANTDGIQKAKFLIEHGADVNARDDNGLTPLMHNSTASIEMARLLIENGADPTMRDDAGRTVLMHMCDRPREVRNRKTWFRVVDREGQVIRKGHVQTNKETIIFLIGLGADINARDTGCRDAYWLTGEIEDGYKGGRSALMLAVENQDWETAHYLLDLGADAGAKDNYGNSVLLRMSWFGENPPFDLVSRLLEGGADINAQDGFGYTMLHKAIPRGEWVEFLVKRGADLNVRDNWGETPLIHFLAHNERARMRKDGKDAYKLEARYEIIRFLLESGADVNVRDKEGMTALGYAEERPSRRSYKRDRELIRILREYGGEK